MKSCWDSQIYENGLLAYLKTLGYANLDICKSWDCTKLLLSCARLWHVWPETHHLRLHPHLGWGFRFSSKTYVCPQHKSGCSDNRGKINSTWINYVQVLMSGICDLFPLLDISSFESAKPIRSKKSVWYIQNHNMHIYMYIYIYMYVHVHKVPCTSMYIYYYNLIFPSHDGLGKFRHYLSESCNKHLEWLRRGLQWQPFYTVRAHAIRCYGISWYLSI